MKSSVLVLGDVGLDRNHHGTASSLSPEGPYPVVKVHQTTTNVSCVGNVVHSIIEFFDHVHLITSLNIQHSDDLAIHLNPNIRHINIPQDDRRMQIINRILVGNYCVARFDEDSDIVVEDENEAKIISEIEVLMHDLDVVILSDYGKGFLTDKICENVIKLCNMKNVPVLVDPFLDDWRKFKGATWIKPNRVEASSVVRKPINKENFIELAQSMVSANDIKYVLCTLDEEGMILGFGGKVQGNCEIVYKNAAPSKVVDVIGCGDALIAALAVLTIQYRTIFSQPSKVIEFLTKVGSVAVSTSGCYHFNRKDCDKLWNEMEVEEKKKKEQKIVFTNGCFDILHPTHLQLLKECKKLGTYFIIGINTDSSVKKIKGESRPINSLEDRVAMLKELELADEIIPFDEDSPLDLIEVIKPDILVKGGDYQLEQIVGHRHVDKTIIFKSPFDCRFSSSKIIAKCKCAKQNEP